MTKEEHLGSSQLGRQINWRLLLPLLVSTTLVALVVPLLRIGTSYQAIDIGLTPGTVGILSAAFALAPVALAIPIGYLNDRHGEAYSLVGGGLMTLAAALGLWLVPPHFLSLLGFSCLLGLGQVVEISALQLTTTRCAGPAHHDTVLGYFMVAASVGQILGPLAVTLTTPAGALTPGQALFAVSAAVTVVLAILACLLVALLPRIDSLLPREAESIGEVVRRPGLIWVVLASSIAVTSNDLILVYFPVIAALARIDVATVGWLLMGRAGGAVLSRVFFAAMARRYGRTKLLVISMIVASAATGALAVPMPVWALAVTMAIAGVGFGLALTAGLSLTLRLVPENTRATALGLRMTASRIGQFVIPLGSAAIVTIAGVGAIMAIMGACLLVSAVLVRFTVKHE